MRLFQQSESVAAKRDLFVQMVDASDLITPVPSLSLTVTIVKAGGTAYGAIAGGWSEIGGGTYKISLAAADLDTLGEAMIRVAAGTVITQCLPIQVLRLLDEVHLIKARLTNDVIGDVASGVVRILDDDQATVLGTLTPIADVVVSGANWTDATRTLSQAGAFANYRWVSGDVIVLSGGTGVIAGQYVIASKTDSDDIVLATDITADDANVGDGSVVGVISNGRVGVIAS